MNGSDVERADGGLVSVYVTHGTRTLAGTGPGVVRVPPDEAGRLVAAKLPIHRSRPPRGLLGDPAE